MLEGFRLLGGIEEADEHFLPGLQAELDGAGGVRIGRVGGGVVEGAGDVEHGAARDLDGLGEAVGELPVEIVAGDVEEGLTVAVGEQQFVLHPFPADVHVGAEGVQGGGPGEAVGGFVAGLGIAGRDLDPVLGDVAGLGVALLWTGVEVEGDLGLVGLFRAVGGVVHLEGEGGAGGHALADAGRVGRRGGARGPAEDMDAVARAIVGATGPACVEDGMVDDAAVARPDVGTRDPEFVREW